ncbi:Oxygen-independent coproporphyrinogen-III oxidase-like protein [bioreactor metagenome]|uniref:Oxygen-independent coproporphyrinogen-III oxidase-like protein n=1 Tax=bioreactor metagenome TaxID=1076179 RepID=A0A645F8W2_9ZZZZ
MLSKLHIKNISEDLDYDMYNLIIERLNNYNHYETSNFSKEGYESKHNLTYWNNEHYYGFGLGASGYIDNVRYENTRSLNHYLEGKYVLEESTLTKNEVIENEFILGFRKLEGININRFKEKYNIDILNIDVVLELLEKGKLINDGSNIKIDNNYVYTANDILINFLGIDYEK